MLFLSYIAFTTRRETCPPVHINSVHLPQQDDVKYLGLRQYVSPLWYELGLYMPEDGILHYHCRGNLTSYISLTG
jgi:hypothetical protein